MARVAHAFDMRVTAWSPNLTPERATAAGAELVGKRALFATADVVSVHLKLGDRSRGLVGVDELRAMRPDAWLVNTSRGPIVEETALLTAVREGWIAGAALDVYDEEPLPAGHPFRDTPGILATGHIGYVTAGNYRSFYTDAVEDLAAFLAGDPVRRLA
jgi:phosphoglycerate dehydrogenase-like enzyme